MNRKRDEITRCAICQAAPVGDDYPGLVCRRCDALALNDAARPAEVADDLRGGDNPVYIDNCQCWRYFQGGTWVTLLDRDNCRDLYDFCRRNGLADPPGV